MFVYYDSNGKILCCVQGTSEQTPPNNAGTPLYLDDMKYADVYNNQAEYTIQNGVPISTPISAANQLASAKTAKENELTAGLNNTLIGGFKSNATGHTYVTTEFGEANMHGDLTRFSLDSTLTSVQFYTVDAGWLAHTPAQLQSAFLDGGKWKDAQYAQYNNLIGQVNSATTVSGVEAVTWTPATY